MTDDYEHEPTTLQTRLWNAIPDLPPHERAKAEGIAGSEEPLTKKQVRAAWAMLSRYTHLRPEDVPDRPIRQTGEIEG